MRLNCILRLDGQNPLLLLHKCGHIASCAWMAKTLCCFCTDIISACGIVSWSPDMQNSSW